MRPARRRVAAEASVAPVLAAAPLPEHYAPRTKARRGGSSAGSAARPGGSEASQAPGHVATLLAHAAGCQGRAAATSPG